MSVHDPASPLGNYFPLLLLCKLISLLSPCVQGFLCCTLIHSPFTPSLRPTSIALFSLQIFLICQPYMIFPVPLNHVFFYLKFIFYCFSLAGLGHLSFPHLFPTWLGRDRSSSALRGFLCPSPIPHHTAISMGDARALLISWQLTEPRPVTWCPQRTRWPNWWRNVQVIAQLLLSTKPSLWRKEIIDAPSFLPDMLYWKAWSLSAL